LSATLLFRIFLVEVGGVQLTRLWITLLCFPQPIALEPFSFDAELDDLPKEELKRMMFEEMQAMP
jgi:hypothetical protein